MDRILAHQAGYETGFSIARENAPDLGPNPTEDEVSQMQEDCATHEIETWRQFTPFEFTAEAINDHENAEVLWDIYEKAVWEGISDAIEQYLGSI